MRERHRGRALRTERRKPREGSEDGKKEIVGGL